jgi:hypothetical protein
MIAEAYRTGASDTPTAGKGQHASRLTPLAQRGASAEDQPLCGPALGVNERIV